MALKNDPIIEQDLVLIYIENKPAFFARVETISPDVKPQWWRVKFLTLTIPLKVITWIIDDEQIRGADFTMGGTLVRIEKVVLPKEIDESVEDVEKPSDIVTPKKARVLSLHTKKNNN